MGDNPEARLLPTKGVDRPIMRVYLAGRIAGECIDKCLSWRQRIINHYANYKGRGVYPISFLDALNSKEADSIDKKGLTSAIPPNLIYDKDILSIREADAVVAMMDDYMEEGISDILFYDEKTVELYCTIHNLNVADYYKESFLKLKEKILNRRPNWGTDYEVSIAMYMGKPVILIAGNERQKAMLEKHPFMKRASVIVGSVEELLEKKWLNILYKSMASSLY
jgi:nucleoside 2-deoxyribosyltransferase